LLSKTSWNSSYNASIVNLMQSFVVDGTQSRRVPRLSLLSQAKSTKCPSGMAQTLIFQELQAIPGARLSILLGVRGS
jgi:hypothetical protein